MHQLPKLPYEYNALEPYIDEETMVIHHTKHHQAYVDKLNKALEGNSDWQDKSVEELLNNFDKLPEDIKGAVQSHGGGHANHSLFWQILKNADEDNKPNSEIEEAINSTYGDFEKFKEEFTKMSLGVFGSGWVWLVKDGSDQLVILKFANQDSPLMKNQKPILGIDVWEHAYYLKYQNRRAEYIENFFKVINWNKVNELFIK